MELVTEKYKLTDIGLIPSDWKVEYLGDIGIFRKGKGIKKDEVLPDGKPCIRYGELYTKHNEYIKNISSFINEETARLSYKIKKGDILFAGSGETKEEIGKCAAFLGDEETYAGGDVVVLTPRDCNSLYLGFLLNHSMIAKQKAQNGQGDAVVHIYPNGLSKITIPLPPTKAEQTAIASALSDADNYITHIEKLIDKKRLIKQGTMQQLLQPKEGWVVKKIKDMISTPVTDGPHETPEFQENGVPFLSVNNLVDNRIDFTELRYISKEDDLRFSLKCKPKRNDLLLGKAASVGKIALVETDSDFNIWSPLALIRLKKDYSPNYLFYSFQTKETLTQIGFFTNSSSQGNIGMGDIEKIEFYLPNQFDEQTLIAACLRDIDIEILRLKKQLTKAQCIKQGMMQQLLTGKIRLV